MHADTPQTHSDRTAALQRAAFHPHDEALMGYESALPWLQVPTPAVEVARQPCVDHGDD